MKHDGFRILVRKLGERAKVWSRRGADFTDRFSTIAEAVGGLSVGRTLDGEAVVLMDDGRSDFHALLTKRGGARGLARWPSTFCLSTCQRNNVPLFG